MSKKPKKKITPMSQFLLGCAISAIGTPIVGIFAILTFSDPVIIRIAFLIMPVIGTIVAFRGMIFICNPKKYENTKVNLKK